MRVPKTPRGACASRPGADGVGASDARAPGHGTAPAGERGPSTVAATPTVPLPYLGGYPAHLLDTVRSDAALFDYADALKSRFLRHAGPLARVAYDATMHTGSQRLLRTLGTQTAVSRVQGGKLKAKRELRVASVFRQAPEAFLKMIVVHELAHLKERDHDKAFYALCTHMEPAYHQLEFDTRLWLTALALEPAAGPSGVATTSSSSSGPAPR
jgi:hypothetical protein